MAKEEKAKSEKSDPPKEEGKKGDKPEKGKKGKKGEGDEGGGPKPVKKEADEGPDFKYIVRIANSDLNGKKHVGLALTGVKGVGHRLAGNVADAAGVSRNIKIGKLSDEEIGRLQEAVDTIGDRVPAWMMNRRNDVSSGDDLHLIRVELDQQHREDLNRLKKIRCYRGVRHEAGQKVRGQRTRANGRTGLAVGVIRAKLQPGETSEKKD